MKYSKLYLSLALMIGMALSFSSCNFVWDSGDDPDPDVPQSIRFAGQWTGDFGMYYTYSHMGHMHTFDSYDTDIVFYPEYDGATFGWGKQVDYYEEGPYSHIYNRFDWEILRGVIYIKYYVDNGMDCAIYDYVMTRDKFSGRFGNTNDKFYLVKIADYYDWSIYGDNYFYYPNEIWQWTPMYKGSCQKNASSLQSHSSASAAAVKSSDGIISMGRRTRNH